MKTFKKRNELNPSSRKRYAHIKIARKLKWSHSCISYSKSRFDSCLKNHECYFNYINIIYRNQSFQRALVAATGGKSAVHFECDNQDAGANTSRELFTKLCLSMGLKSLALAINAGKMKQRHALWCTVGVVCRYLRMYWLNVLSSNIVILQFLRMTQQNYVNYFSIV